MKRYFSIFLAFILIFNITFIPFSYANTIEQLDDVELGSGISNIEGLNGQEGELSELETYTPDNSISVTGIFATILTLPIKIFDIIYWPLMKLTLILPTIDGCIFNTQDIFNLSFFDAKPDGLAGKLQGSVSAIYNALRYLVTAVYIVVLVYLAIRMMLSSIGRQKAHYKELFKHWIVGLLLLFSFHWVMAFVIWLSNSFVEILAGFSTEILAGLTPSLAVSQQNIQDYPITSFVVSRISHTTDVSGGLAALLGVFMPIVGPILAICLLASAFSIIITYFKRLFTIAILILTFPLVALSYVFDKIGDRKAQTLSIWLKEFMVNVMIQPIHAIILVFIAMIYSTGLSSSSPLQNELFGGGIFGPHLIGAIMSIIALRLIPVGENLLKKLFQINSTMGPGSQGIAGSMARAGMAFQGAKAMAGSLKQVGSGAARHFRGRQLGKELWKQSDEKKALDRQMNGQGYFAKKFANSAAKKDFLKTDNAAAYKKFNKETCEKLGTKSLAAARAKTVAQFAGAAAGVGSAITGADSGKFLSEAAAKAVIGSTITSGIFDSKENIKNLIHGDLKKAEDFESRARHISEDFDKLTDADKKKIATELGISVDLVTSDNKDKLTKAYKDMGLAARYGGDTAKIKEFTQFHQEAKNLEKGLMPDGSGKIDLNLFDADSQIQTKNGVFATKDGIRYQISTHGNADLKDGEEISVGKSPQELMEKDKEYKKLETRKAEVSHTIANKETEVQSLEIAKEEARSNKESAHKVRNKARERERDTSATLDIRTTELQEAVEAYTLNPTDENRTKRDTASRNYDAAVASHNEAQAKLDTANAEYRDSLMSYRTAFEEHSTAKSELSRAQSEERSIETKMEKIEEATQKKCFAAEKASMELGAAPIFAETAYKEAQDTTKYPNATYRNDSTGSYVDLGNGQTYTIRTQSTPGMTSVSFSPAEFSNQMSAAQERYVNAVANNDINAMQIAESEIQSLQSFNEAITEQFNQNLVTTIETDEGFDSASCANVNDVLSKYVNKDYTIQLTRQPGNILQCNIWNSNGVAIHHPDLMIDVGPTSGFNNDKLNNIGDSIKVVQKDAPFGGKGWFIVKQ